MEKEYLFNSVKLNLDEFSNREKIITEQKNILISELGGFIIANMPSEPPETLYKEFLTALPNAELSDKLSFIEALASHYNTEELLSLLLSGDTEGFSVAGAHGKISYIRNKYNDEAFASFASIIPHAKPVYHSDFEACCEALSADECEFTILPLEDTSDGKMFGFYSMLDRYELKIVYVSSVEREEQSKVIRYALAGKRFKLGRSERTKNAFPKVFEFSLTHSSKRDMLDIYTAADAYSAEEHRTSSISLPYGDDMARFYHSFVISKNTRFLPFLLFLSLEYPRYTPIGVYREI